MVEKGLSRLRVSLWRSTGVKKEVAQLKLFQTTNKYIVMRINDITIKNFRGIENKSFPFNSKMNVVIGDNTTGKTTLLSAVEIALGAYLQELTLASGCSRNFKKSDFVSKYSSSTKGFNLSEYKPEICVNAQVDTLTYDANLKSFHSLKTNIPWTRTSSRNSRKNAGKLMDFVSQMEKYRREADDTGIISVLPLMLSFGADRLESASYNGAEKTKARASRIEKAYKCALDQKVDFKGAFDWIYRYETEIKKNREFKGTDTAFLNALYDAIPALKEIVVDRKNNEFIAKIQMTKDPESYWLSYNMMSAGFQSMINIVAEIAHRCIELNSFLGLDSVKKTPGIVLIDEIDLYLHPHWQQHILADLQAAFPEIQFIVTTHSPFIVQSVETQNVITLDGQNAPISPTNRGIEEILACEMGMQGMLRSDVYRTKQALARQYFELVKAGKDGDMETEAVKKRLNELELEAGLLHDPAYEAFLKLNRGNL